MAIEPRHYLLAGAGALLLYWWSASAGRVTLRDLRLDRVLPATGSKMIGDVGRRCALGCQTWPADDDYLKCPRCGEPTSLYRGQPLSNSDALSLRRNAEFDYYYDHEHVRDADPLTQDELVALGLSA